MLDPDAEIVTDEHHDDLDEIYTHFFRCPKCNFSTVIINSNYCSNCGVKLVWQVCREYNRWGIK